MNNTGVGTYIYKCPHRLDPMYENCDYGHQVNSLVGLVSSLPHYCQMIMENNKWKPAANCEWRKV